MRFTRSDVHSCQQATEPISANIRPAALRSQKVVGKLRADLGFQGIIMADDLDSQATMRGDPVAEVAIDALNAGCHFLLLADTGSQLDDVAAAIETAAQSGRLSAEALSASADRVRALARDYATDGR